MRVGLDTTRINIPDGGGRYTNEMLSNLCEGFPLHEFYAFGPKPRQAHTYPNLIRIPYPEVDGVRARMIYALNMASHVKAHGIDVFHNLCNYGYYRTPCPTVTTIHDLLTLRFAELRSNKLHWWLYKLYLPTLIRRASWIITDSQSTQKDLQEFLGIRRNVTTVRLGYSRALFHTEDTHDAEVLRRLQLAPGYLLFVGYLTPKKNIEVLLRALAILSQEKSLQLHLVLVGKRGYRAERVFHEAEQLGLRNQATELGFVPDGSLGALYRQARLFLFPSRYEGFGLPVIEAMACGTPVLTSDVASLPEIVGNTRYTCPPDAPVEWAMKINELLCDEAQYTQAREWCLGRAERFSWEACVRTVMSIYESVAERRHANS